MKKLILKFIFLMIFGFYGGESYCQKKNSFFMEYGFAFQYSKPRIQDSKYCSISNPLSPKLFLGLGVEHKLNKRISLCLNINTNLSRTQSNFNYFNDSDQVSYKSNSGHVDINYGLAVGIKYVPWFGRGKFSIGTGLNFQKLSPQMTFHENSFSGGIDTSTITMMEIYNSNNFEKNYNSFIYYLNGTFSFGKKRKMDYIFELNSTLNKPLWGSHEFYYNNQLIERTNFKVNMAFFVFKIRRRF